MEFLALFPAFIAAFVALKRSPAVAFLHVYLPVLLLCPDYYRWMVTGIPKPSLSEAAVLPIAAVLLVRGLRWRFSMADFLVFGFAFWLGWSEYQNAGYKEAQNLMFDMVTAVLFPYLCAKALIEPLGLRAAFARSLVWPMFFVSILSVYEFRMGATPFRLLLDPLFPGQGTGWITTFRWGYARIAGPYSHAILAGIVLLCGWRIARWLEGNGHWNSRLPIWKYLPVSQGRVLSLGLLSGLLMTMARGPWIGAGLATTIAVAGASRKRKRAFVLLGLGVLLVGIPAAVGLYRYSAVGRADARSAEQETAAYRKELVEKYIDIALERSVYGWGRSTWPKVPNMPSVDNYYLLLALMHGLPAVALFTAITVAMPVRLISAGMRQMVPRRPGSSLAFTLAGLYVGIAFAVGTVYMGKQVIPLFALLTGWSEGYLLSENKDVPASSERRPTGMAVFRRVVA